MGNRCDGDRGVCVDLYQYHYFRGAFASIPDKYYHDSRHVFVKLCFIWRRVLAAAEESEK